MNGVVSVFRNPQSHWGHKYLRITPPCGKCQVFLGLCRGCHGSVSEGLPDKDVRRVVEEDVREGSQGDDARFRGNNGGGSKRGRRAFPLEGSAQAEAWRWAAAQGRVRGCGTGNIPAGAGETGRGHSPDSLGRSRKELGLPRRRELECW